MSPPAGATLLFRASSLGVLANNATIAQWNDESGGGYHLANAVDAQRPVWDNTDSAVSFPLTKPLSGTPQLSNAAFPFNRNALSFLWVGRTDSSDAARYAVTFGALTFVLLFENGLLRVFRGSTTATTLAIPTGRLIAIIVTCSGGAVNVYLDTAANVSSLSGNGSSAGTGLNIGTSAFLIGEVKELRAWNRTLTAQEVSDALTYAAQTYGTGGVPAATSGNVVIDGDSTSAGTGPWHNRVWHTRMGISSSWLMRNFAVAGQRLDQMITDIAEVNVYANGTNWLFAYGGYNDLSVGDSGATVESELAAYCNAAITGGFAKSNIVTFTLTTSGAPTARDDANTAIRANYTAYAGHLVDVAADSQLGVTPGGGFLNPSNFADGVHMNDAGSQLMANLVRSAIPSLPF